LPLDINKQATAAALDIQLFLATMDKTLIKSNLLGYNQQALWAAAASPFGRGGQMHQKLTFSSVSG
jgi:hypothetical protein